LGARIAVLVDENPRREGTRAEKVFKLYQRPTVRTVADFLEKGREIGAGSHDLRWDVARGYIKVKRQHVGRRASHH
jgi:hypothetical protein